MSDPKLDPVHLGEVLPEEFRKPMGLSRNRLAPDTGVHPRRINENVLGKRSIRANTALRVARYFATTPKFWLGLQGDFDLDRAMDEMGGKLERDVKMHAPVAGQATTS
jgi:addiction module HigA family antidote